MMNPRWTPALLVAGLVCAVGCEEKRKVINLQKPTIVDVPLQSGAPGGVRADLKLDHFTQATFADITGIFPEKTLSGACVEGNSFEQPGDVYILRLFLHNDSDRDLPQPELRVRRPNPSVGAEEVVFHSGSKKVSARGQTGFIYFWDPGIILPQGTVARLVWAP